MKNATAQLVCERLASLRAAEHKSRNTRASNRLSCASRTPGIADEKRNGAISLHFRH